MTEELELSATKYLIQQSKSKGSLGIQIDFFIESRNYRLFYSFKKKKFAQQNYIPISAFFSAPSVQAFEIIRLVSASPD